MLLQREPPGFKDTYITCSLSRSYYSKEKTQRSVWDPVTVNLADPLILRAYCNEWRSRQSGTKNRKKKNIKTSFVAVIDLRPWYYGSRIVGRVILDEFVIFFFFLSSFLRPFLSVWIFETRNSNFLFFVLRHYWSVINISFLLINLISQDCYIFIDFIILCWQITETIFFRTVFGGNWWWKIFSENTFDQIYPIIIDKVV